MPLREVVCAAGHRTEVLLRSNTPLNPCSCGAAASLSSVNRIAVGFHHKWGSEFEWTPDMLDAHEEAKGFKREYVEARKEAELNGFR